jgi:predicted short-subunit dehydrogenase-like oxidoreductase (DUF2520 family)
MMRIGIIGAGVVGTALAVSLSRKGYLIEAVASRSRSSAERLVSLTRIGKVYDSRQDVVDKCDFVFITTPDDAIPVIASQTRWHAGQYVVHCSGADSTDVLEPVRWVSASPGSFHPLQTFAGIQQAIENLPGSTFALEAGEPLLSILKEMAGAAGGKWVQLKAGQKAAYHAAAVMSCNYLITLVKMATDLWESFGVPREQAVQALLPLIKGTVRNIESVGIPAGLTGPIARGDIGTIRIHIDALQQTSPGIIPAYCEMGLQTIPIALAKGKIDERCAQELEALLRETQKSYVEREAKCVRC